MVAVVIYIRCNGLGIGCMVGCLWPCMVSTMYCSVLPCRVGLVLGWLVICSVHDII